MQNLRRCRLAAGALGACALALVACGQSDRSGSSGEEGPGPDAGAARSPDAKTATSAKPTPGKDGPVSTTDPSDAPPTVVEPTADGPAPVESDGPVVGPDDGPVVSDPGEQPDQPACLRMTNVMGGAGALGTAIAAAQPGDCLIVADGAYGDLTVTATGTAAAPIQVRAANLLKATAGALVVARSAYVVVQGFTANTLLIDASDYARVTRCAIKGGAGPAWVRIDVQKGCMSGCTSTPPSSSKYARIDHCDIGPGTTGGDIMNPTAMSEHARIDHNHFHDVSGRHVITVGCCGPMYDYHDSLHVLEYNLFTNVRGGELISIKGSAVDFRYNTIRNGGGDTDIRAGRHDNIYGNFIFGGGGGGIRMYEDDHKIYNNYIATGKALQMGPANAGHAAIKRATVVYNTFLGSVSTSGTGNVITNNIGVGGDGNLAAAAAGLVKTGEIMVPGPGSKAIGAGAGMFAFVTEDVTGAARGAKLDVGAAQAGAAGPRKPLTPADVGPNAP